jgi:hypothetical protein
MDFSPYAKAVIMLVALVLSFGVTSGVTAFLGGAHWAVSLLIGVGAAATNVYHALSESPKEKAAKGLTKPPFA